MSVSTYALTSLAAFYAYSGVATGNDAVLEPLIDGVSAEIERVTGRRFKARDYRWWLNGACQRRLLLPVRPVQRVTRVAYGCGNAMSLSYSGSAIDATADVYDDPESPAGGGLRLFSMSAGGTETVNTFAFSTYKTVSTLAAAVNLVSGWSATTLVDVRTLELRPVSQEAKSTTAWLTYPDLRLSSYAVDHQRGRVEFERGGDWGWGDYGRWAGSDRFPRQFAGVMVMYRGGYETIPADVAMACNELVKEQFMTRTQNTAVAGMTLGPYSVTFSGQQVEKVRRRLASYLDAGAVVGTSA